MSSAAEKAAGYASLTQEDYHMLTGLPPEAYEEWLKLDEESRIDVIGIFQTPGLPAALYKELRNDT